MKQNCVIIIKIRKKKIFLVVFYLFLLNSLDFIQIIILLIIYLCNWMWNLSKFVVNLWTYKIIFSSQKSEFESEPIKSIIKP